MGASLLMLTSIRFCSTTCHDEGAVAAGAGFRAGAEALAGAGAGASAAAAGLITGGAGGWGTGAADSGRTVEMWNWGAQAGTSTTDGQRVSSCDSAAAGVEDIGAHAGAAGLTGSGPFSGSASKGEAGGVEAAGFAAAGGAV